MHQEPEHSSQLHHIAASSGHKSHRQDLVLVEEDAASLRFLVSDSGENLALAHESSEGLECQRIPGPPVRIHRMVLCETGTCLQPVPETFRGASWHRDTCGFRAESSGRLEALEGLHCRESNL